jgi:hypothetical protein
MLAGVRLLDKSRDGRENNFRMEIWTKFNSDTDDVGVKMKAYIENKFVAFLSEENKDQKSTPISFSVHKQAAPKVSH